jgi:hypothetical protein
MGKEFPCICVCIYIYIYIYTYIYYVTHMPIARQLLGKHIPEAYAVNSRITSIAR